MKKKTCQMLAGYGLLMLAFVLLIGPTIVLAKLRQPQLIALKTIENPPGALSAQRMGESTPGS